MKKPISALILIAAVLSVGASACGGGEWKQHSHEYTKSVTAPTCTARGNTTYVCACGYRYVGDYTDPLGHTFEGNVCTRCGYERHDHVYDKTVVAPTCTEQGYTRGVCKICGATYTADIKDPLGHAFEGGVCTRCGNPDYTSGLEYKLSSDGEYYIFLGIGEAKDLEIVIPAVYNGKPVKTINLSSMWELKNCASLKIPKSVENLIFSNYGEYDYLSDGFIALLIIENPLRYLSNLTIYCEAAEKPENWMDNWNGICPVVWDCNNNDVADDGKIYAVRAGIRYALSGGAASVDWQPTSVYKNVEIPLTVNYKDNEYAVTEIKAYAFGNIRAESITLSENIVAIGANAFNIEGLKEIKVSKDNPYYYVESNCLIEAHSRTLIKGFYNSVIPDDGSVTAIGEYAFENCDQIKEVTIPRHVKTIEKFAFYGCRNLCSVYIPSEVAQIEDSSFSGAQLTLYCEAAAKPAGWEVYPSTRQYAVVWNCKNNEIADDGYIYKFIDGKRYGLKDGAAAVAGQPEELSGDIVVPQSVTLNGKGYPVTNVLKNAFQYTDIESVILPDGIKTIGENAFYYCQSLKRVDIGQGLENIGQTAFAMCGKLELINFKGTIAQWKAIPHSDRLYLNRCTIECTDGSINAVK